MTNNQLIARFSFENKMFCISLNKDKEITYSYLDNEGRLHFDLSQDDLELVLDVTETLRVEETRSYYIRDEKINNKLYEIFYDPLTDNYFWKSSQENNITDNIFLNMKYNNTLDIVYERDDDSFSNKQESYYKKEFRKSKKRISVFINAGVSLAFLTGVFALGNILNTNMQLLKEAAPTTSIVEIQDVEHSIPSTTEFLVGNTEWLDDEGKEVNYSWEVIRKTIENNPNIGEQEKDFLYKLKFIFDEHHQYMDLALIIDRLETLRIEYVKEVNLEVDGTYSSTKNLITIYGANSFETTDIGVFCHEVSHVFQSKFTVSRFFELSNSKFSDEILRRLHANEELDNFYSRISPNIYSYGNARLSGYTYSMYIFYYLAELMPQEVLINYQYNPNDQLIVKQLCKNSQNLKEDQNLAYKLLDLISKYILTSSNLSEDKRMSLKQEICNLIYYFYELNGINLEESVAHYANNLSAFERFSEEKAGFLLSALEKNDYMKYNVLMNLKTSVQWKTYFSNVFPDTKINLKFSFRGGDFNKIDEILTSNGDKDKIYELNLDNDFISAYLNYTNSNNKVK